MFLPSFFNNMPVERKTGYNKSLQPVWQQGLIHYDAIAPVINLCIWYVSPHIFLWKLPDPDFFFLS